MKILETERLALRELDSAIDAEFIFELLNTPKFLKYIGDRGVRSVEQAREFIENRYGQSYRENGYGLYLVEVRMPLLRADLCGDPSTPATRIGLCGFVKRDTLPDPDLGFAFLPAGEGKGYGFESASGILRHGKENLGFSSVLAITSLDNYVSIKLLEKLGFTFEKIYTTPEGEDVRLFEKLL